MPCSPPKEFPVLIRRAAFRIFQFEPVPKWRRIAGFPQNFYPRQSVFGVRFGHLATILFISITPPKVVAFASPEGQRF